LSDWLSAEADIAELWPLLDPCDASSLRMWPVSSAVNRVGNDGPDLLRPVAIPPTLGLAQAHRTPDNRLMRLSCGLADRPGRSSSVMS
jgi:hypothetical protein